MKILFLCGSLEYGKDGVGDYVRQLASEIIRQGHFATAIALNDKFVDTYSLETVDHLQLVRIPAVSSESDKYDHLKKYIKDFNPEWISLQFVPFAFNKGGFTFGLGTHLKKISRNAKWHIMFHELWVGKDKGTNWKRELVSIIQKRLVSNLITKLSPQIIHTHLPVFYSKIKGLGRDAKQLPLFSNIKVFEEKVNNNENIFRVGFFSQVEADECIMKFLNSLAKSVFEAGLEFEILLIGGNDFKMREIGDVLTTINYLNRPIKYTGFLNNKGISAAIHSCNMGITPVPRHALGKSGSVAAFITHKIPVASPNIHFMYKRDEIGFFNKDLCNSIIISPNLSDFANAKIAVAFANDHIQLSTITEFFLSDLVNFNDQ
jgi:hypothetical protein